MHLRWDGDTPLADAEMVGALYEVSTRTVRRHCTPDRRLEPAGPGSVQALYDVFAAAAALDGIAARPQRTAAGMRAAAAFRRHARRNSEQARATGRRPGQSEPEQPTTPGTTARPGPDADRSRTTPPADT